MLVQFSERNVAGEFFLGDIIEITNRFFNV